MKQLLLVVLMITLVLGFSVALSAQSSVDVRLNITIVNSGLSVTTEFPTNNWMVTNGYNVSGSGIKGTVINDGSIPIDLDVRISDEGSTWTADVTAPYAPGAGVYHLQGLFCQWDLTLSDSDFGSEDTLTTTDQSATACDGTHIFARNNAGDGNFDGVGIPAVDYNQVFIRFRFAPPTDVSPLDKDGITIRMTASGS